MSPSIFPSLHLLLSSTPTIKHFNAFYKAKGNPYAHVFFWFVLQQISNILDDVHVRKVASNQRFPVMDSDNCGASLQSTQCSLGFSTQYLQSLPLKKQ